MKVLHINDNFGEIPREATMRILNDFYNAIQKKREQEFSLTANRFALKTLEDRYNRIIDEMQDLIRHHGGEGDLHYMIERFRLDGEQRGIEQAMRCFGLRFEYDRDSHRYYLRDRKKKRVAV